MCQSQNLLFFQTHLFQKYFVALLRSLDQNQFVKMGFMIFRACVLVVVYCCVENLRRRSNFDCFVDSKHRHHFASEHVSKVRDVIDARVILHSEFAVYFFQHALLFVCVVGNWQNVKFDGLTLVQDYLLHHRNRIFAEAQFQSLALWIQVKDFLTLQQLINRIRMLIIMIDPYLSRIPVIYKRNHCFLTIPRIRDELNFVILRNYLY